jgi:hypothetical protein
MQFILSALLLTQAISAQMISTTCLRFNDCVTIHRQHQEETCAVLSTQNATQAAECKCHYDARLLACYDQCPDDDLLVQERPAMENGAQAVCQPLGLNYKALPQGSWVKTPISSSSAAPSPTGTASAAQGTNAPSATTSPKAKSDANKAFFSLSALIGSLFFML